MGYTVVGDELLEALRMALIVSKKYTVKIANHQAVAIFQDSKRALVKDINKIVKKDNDGKLPKCFLLVFSDFKLVVIPSKVKKYKITNKIVLEYENYKVEIYEDPTA